MEVVSLAWDPLCPNQREKQLSDIWCCSNVPGTTSILEAFRVLVSSGFQPVHHPVEFHWNSAEEGGLLGSKAIAQDYQRRGIRVKSYHQNDMTAWVKAGTKPTIGLITDYVDSDYTAFLGKVIEEYCE